MHRVYCLCVTALFAACTDVTLIDDLAPVANADGDGLHTPYVRGAHVWIDARSAQLSGLRVESRTPAVLTAVDRGARGTEFLAVASGVAALAVVDGDATVHEETVEVVTPDAVDLQIADAAACAGCEVPVASGALLTLTYRAGERALYGDPAGQLTLPAGVTLERIDEARPVFRVLDAAPGTYPLRVFVDGEILGNWTLVVD